MGFPGLLRPSLSADPVRQATGNAGAVPGNPLPALRARGWWRLREGLWSFLPLLLMALLALASWWLVENAPQPPAPPVERALSSEPDYTMTRFVLERFDAAGKLKLRIQGVQLRHIPSTDRIDIEAAQIRAVAADGRVTEARAARAVGNGDGSELQLMGGAEVTSVDSSGLPLSMQGEFLHAYLVTERVRSHLPVLVRQGNAEMRAAALDYDHVAQRLELKGPLRTELPPRPLR